MLLVFIGILFLALFCFLFGYRMGAIVERGFWEDDYKRLLEEQNFMVSEYGSALEFAQLEAFTHEFVPEKDR